ncbi:MAG: aminotransferase class I and II [Bacteroidetes bacterium MedPE-SWsnd-G2]|nr:MAG: aminotransferase class I and II [Bacteroidetes bacterium MedPE-SWsnd-G2]
MKTLDLRTVDVVQYLNPLREGGSMPAIVKADDDFLYVLKFRGAGQGKRALVSEILGGELARAIGLHVPELVLMNLDNSFSKTEPDEEIQDLLKFSVGLNLGLHFLSRAITYDPLVGEVDALTASKVVLLDSIISNIDRTAKNTNLLQWNKELWLIDHGASFYFHHNWNTWEQHLERTFPLIKDHVLLPKATQLETAAIDIKQVLNPELVDRIIESIPEAWLETDMNDMSTEAVKAAYKAFICSRINKIDELVKEANHAR